MGKNVTMQIVEKQYTESELYLMQMHMDMRFGGNLIIDPSKINPKLAEEILKKYGFNERLENANS
jgi:hypothetical protein